MTALQDESRSPNLPISEQVNNYTQQANELYKKYYAEYLSQKEKRRDSLSFENSNLVRDEDESPKKNRERSIFGSKSILGADKKGGKDRRTLTSGRHVIPAVGITQAHESPAMLPSSHTKDHTLTAAKSSLLQGKRRGSLMVIKSKTKASLFTKKGTWEEGKDDIQNQMTVFQRFYQYRLRNHHLFLSTLPTPASHDDDKALVLYV